MEIRRAQPADATALIRFDEIARTDPRRVTFIQRVVASPTCFVAVERDTVVAYADLTYALYDVGMIDMLYISRSFRRRGIGSALMRYLEHQCITPKLFTSTNRSNLAMQALLANLGYHRSGLIEGLNDNDPELVFMKRLGNKAV